MFLPVLPGSLGTIRKVTDLLSLVGPIPWQGNAIAIASDEGSPAKGGDAMPLRRTIGISLAFLVISASAFAETGESGTTQASGNSLINKHGKVATRHRKSWTASCSQAQRVAHHGRRSRHGYADSSPPDSTGSGPPDVYSGPAPSI